jgi:hypothetical protein
MVKSGDSKSVIAADTSPVIRVTRQGDGLWPKVVTVDFGTGCEGLNNNVLLQTQEYESLILFVEI